MVFTGNKEIIDKTMKDLSKTLLLTFTGNLTEGKTVNFIGRRFKHEGSYIAITLTDDYVEEMLKEAGLTNCKPVSTTGTTVMKVTADGANQLDQERHRRHRRQVGKLQLLSLIRPDI